VPLASFFTLPLVFLLVGALLILLTSWLIARALLRPPRMTDGKAMYVLRRLSPGDLKLAFENVAFDVRDQQTGGASKLRIAGWWIPHVAARGRCVILLHGYADAKVGAISWAPLWHAMEFNILALDLRAHGESGGRDTTGGFFERHDLSQVIDQLQVERPDDARQVVLFGASLGGAVAIATAELRQGYGSPIDALVLECPIADYRHALITHAARLGAPRTIVMPLALRMAQAISRARFDDVRPTDLLRRVTCPVMLAQAAEDRFVGHADMDALERALRERSARSVVWRVPNAAHLMGIATAPDEYARRLEDFLETSLHDTSMPPVIARNKPRTSPT
jgi:pimeloyl-ACP methyl ester carboxylesterase